MIWIAIAVLLIVFLTITFLRPAQPKGEYKRAEFLSLAEKSFLRALDASVGTKYRIFAKVRLADIISPSATSASSWQTRFNRISAKHVDFLLCGLTDTQPICAIELDDKSHQAHARAQRDNFLNHALESAGTPLARFQAGRTYSSVEIEANIDAVTSRTPKTPQPPACPKCGKAMVLRTAHSGTHAGEQFWGCPGYPLCTAIVKLK